MRRLPGLRLTSWDWRLLARAAVATALAFLLTWLVTAATDEGGISWGERAGRTLPVAPACAALGVWAALAPAIARGEVRALASLGRSAAQIGAPAVAGAGLVVLVAAVVLAFVHRVDVDGFFPTAAHAAGWRWGGRGFVDPVRGLAVGPEGVIERLPPDTAARATVFEVSAPPHGRAAAAIATALSGIGLPLLLAHALLTRPRRLPFGRRDWHALFLGAGPVAASVFLFQAAASRHVPALLGTAPAALLLGFGVQRYRSYP